MKYTRFALLLLLAILPLSTGAQNYAWHSYGPNFGIPSNGSFGYSPNIVLDTAGTPYICYGTKESYPAVKKYNDTGWTEVGTLINFLDSVARVYYTDIAVDKQNNVYVAFASHYDSLGHTISDGKFRVIKWDGVTWTQVGSTIRFNDDATSPYGGGVSLAIDSDDSLYLAFTGIAPGFSYPFGMSSSVVKFDGTNWNRIAGSYSYIAGGGQLKLVTDTSDQLYLLSVDGWLYDEANVYKWTDTGWIVIANKVFNNSAGYGHATIEVNKATNDLFVVFPDSIHTYNSNGWQFHSHPIGYTTDLEFTTTGKPIISYSLDGSPLAADQRLVREYNGTSWESVGGPYPYVTFGSGHRMAISKADEIFLTYYQISGMPHQYDVYAEYYGPEGLSVSSIPSENILKVYPNPVKGSIFNIDALPAGNYQLNIINTLGQVVYHTNLKQTGNTSATINLPTAYPRGVYHLKINGTSGKYNSSVIIE